MIKKYKVPVEVAAKLMDKGAEWVRAGLVQKELPIGAAFKVSGNTYSYYISPQKFMEYTGCTDKDIEAVKRGEAVED